jgi:hypothetical protein
MTGTALTVTPAAARPLTSTVHPVVNHALKAGELQTNLAARETNLAARAIGNVSATAQVFAFGIDAESLEELAQLRAAAWQRLNALQTGWMRDWKHWFQYSGQIKGANTMSKLVEREGNIAAQFAQLVGKQVTDLVGLQENILVDYSFWINQKLREKREAAAGP